MNKKILSLAILSATTLSFANDGYVVLVDREHNSYTTSFEENSYVEYTEWVMTNQDCSTDKDWTPETTYFGVNYDITTTCVEDYTRDKKTYVYDEDRKPVLDSTETETKQETTNASESFVGTFKARNCKEILDSNGSTGDGSYAIYKDSTPFQGHCDMTNGGWTLAMKFDEVNQLSGSGRTNFWNSGGTLGSGFAYSTFSKLELSDQGFLGWDRVKGMMNGSDLEVRVVGANRYNTNVVAEYTLQSFAPIMTNTTIESGTLAGGGVYTVAKYGDTNTKNGWGTCGTGIQNNAHVGLGICPEGLNSSGPYADELQIWHYGTYHGDFNYNINISFGNKGQDQGSTATYGLSSRPIDFKMYIK
jgi:hypothetical protein